VTDRVREQLAALGRVDGALEEAGIEYWLFGGWAVDFHHGTVTRAHDDVDIAVWSDDVARITELLQEDGWKHVPSEDDNGGTGFERGAVRLELTYLVGETDGIVYIPLRDGRAPWPDGAFGSDVLELMGTRARVVALAALLRTKSVPRDDPDDAPKDRADYRVLRQIV
jgi:hypothetical protein